MGGDWDKRGRRGLERGSHPIWILFASGVVAAGSWQLDAPTGGCMTAGSGKVQLFSLPSSA